MKKFIEDAVFERVEGKAAGLEMAEYDNCTFRACDFSEMNLTGYQFSECQFVDCNLSLATVFQTAFRKVDFKNCKLLGVKFEVCNPFLLELNFDQCLLNHASFYQLKLKQIHFKACNLQEVDFTETDLSGAVFEHSDLLNAVFERTVLEKADLRTAFNYRIDPDANQIQKARFSLSGLPGLLSRYQIEIE